MPLLCPGKNNLQRKKMYRKAAKDMGYKWRQPLPWCVLIEIRNVFPSEDGYYMGYKAGPA